MNKFRDAHYFPLPSQGNIYTITDLNLANGTSKLLVASLKREVYCFEYSDSPKGTLAPTTREVSFTYIPSGAEIISIDAFNKSEVKNDFVIGITIVKNSSDSNTLETYLNIYSEGEESEEFNMENIAQNCLNVELNYIPYHLTHTTLVIWSDNEIINKEVVFLLTGSDEQIHVYRENTTGHTYKEIESKEFFPEFYKPPSVVMWVEILYFNNFSERVTAFCCECGYLRLCRISIKTNKIMFNLSTRFDQLITCVNFYVERNEQEKPKFLQNFEGKDKQTDKDNLIINLVAVNSVLPAVYFNDILNYGLNKYGPLARYEMTSVFTSMEAADVDFDGQTEILMSNSICEILLYRFNNKKLCWFLDEIKQFPSPVFCIKYIDVTGDGLKELIVLTIKGVHILQYDPVYIQKCLEEKIENMAIPNIKEIKI